MRDEKTTLSSSDEVLFIKLHVFQSLLSFRDAHNPKMKDELMRFHVRTKSNSSGDNEETISFFFSSILSSLFFLNFLYLLCISTIVPMLGILGLKFEEEKGGNIVIFRDFLRNFCGLCDELCNFSI